MISLFRLVAASAAMGYIGQRGRGRAILVIDECSDPVTVQRLRDEADRLPEGFIALLIGTYDTPVNEPGRMSLLPMTNESIEKVLEDYMPLSPRRSQVASLCGGYPKLAVLIGDAITRSPDKDLSIDQLLIDGDLIGYLKAGWGPQGYEGDSSLLAGLSLLTKVGWFDDLVQDGKLVCRMVNLDHGAAQISLGRLRERGIVIKSGRFVYISPTILALHEASKILRGWDKAKFLEFYRSLTPQGRLSLMERIRQSGTSAEFERIVQSLVDSSFFFEDFAEFESSGTSELFRLLLPAFPNVLLDRLEALMLRASRERLRASKKSRRDIVWSLEELVWWPEHFERCARLILSLAAAENEDFGNNASGVWESLYKVMLAGTTTPYEQRLPLLIEALRSEDSTIRRLATKALGMAFETGTITGTSGPRDIVGRTVPPHWQPKTVGEWKGIIEGLVPHLIASLGDRDDAVKQTAYEVLTTRVNDLVNAGLDEAVTKLIAAVKESSFDLRARLIEMFDWTLEHAQELKARRRLWIAEMRRELSGRSFAERVRELTQSWENGYRMESKPSVLKQFGDLAEEIALNPAVLAEILPWLCGGSANSAFSLGWVLAGIDSENRVIAVLLSLWTPELKDHRFYSGFIVGLLNARGVPWIQSFLDELGQKQRTALLAANGTWQVDGTDIGAARLQKLIGDGVVPPGFVRNLPYGFWSREVPAKSLDQLLRTAFFLDGEETIAGSIDVVAQFLSAHPEQLLILEELCWMLLDATLKFELRAMDEYSWVSLGKLLVDRRPSRMASATLALLRNRDTVHSRDDFTDLLSRSIKAGGEQVFQEVIGPAIDQKPDLLWRFGNRIVGRNLLDEIAPRIIIDWVEQDVEQRIVAYTHAASVPEDPKDSLAREILVRWGNRAEVQSILAASFQSGSWWGPETGWMKGKLAALEKWKADPDQNVRGWAAAVASAMQQRLPQAETSDEERELR